MQRSLNFTERIPVLILIMVLVWSSLSVICAPFSVKHAGALGIGNQDLALQQSVPPTDAFCRAQAGVACYSPQEFQNAYSVTPLLNAGYTGVGQTIVIVDSFGSPTIRQDLTTFDADFGLPAPQSFRILAPLGTVPFDVSNPQHLLWATETTLDVEWAHALAPGANIVLLTSPVDETQGVQGLPEFLQLESYALKYHLGSIISQSWSTAENTLFTPEGREVMQAYNQFYAEAALQHVTILSSSGDTGVANVDVNGNTFPFPTVNFPASSPLVTAVGGTALTADTQGTYQSEVAWNDGTHGATGGGISQQFREPFYQRLTLSAAAKSLLHDFRGVPDVSINASGRTGILIYLSFAGQPGYHLIGGTSEGAPQWAGIIAIANQEAGHPLGFLNPLLYLIAKDDKGAFHDIINGDNSAGNITGYSAGTGWDATTGLGTPIASVLVRDLSSSFR